MDEHVKQNILRILAEAVDSIKINNIKKLKDLSNETIHDATIHQDEYSITLSVMIHTLSKIYERDFHYKQFKGWKNFYYESIELLETARNYLKQDNIQEFDSKLKSYIHLVQKVDKKLVNYIQDVLRKAKITKASRLYEHGLSLGRTAELLGITKFELMDYLGKTYIADMKENQTISAEQRLKFTRGLFI